MRLKAEVRKRTYHDSIVLMQASKRMLGRDGTVAAMVAMGTELNLELIRSAGLWTESIAGAGPDDLVLVVKAEDPDAALAEALAALAARVTPPAVGEAAPPRTVRAAARRLPGANLALISVPGEHAAWACADALAQGLNVFCFSDNVSLEDEVRLKREAIDKGLLFMGPDCGTAILDGVGLGFSNAVPGGRIGIVGASGTGIQQLACLLAHQGVGISQAIGVGGRDLSPEVGGLMTREAIRRLDADPGTDQIVVVSKSGSAELSARKPLHNAVLGSGADLTEIALSIGGGRLPDDPPLRGWEGPVTGIFSGGTLKEEAELIWAGGPEFSAIDYGDDRYTRGRPHPMIDQTLRLEAIGRARGLVYIDVVLGRGAHPDPAAELAPALEGRPAVVVLIGCEGDPQGFARQREAFIEAGAGVFISNSRAARAVLARRMSSF